MENLGNRMDFHTHSLHSDGALLPSEALRYAISMGYAAFAITDHVDYSNMESVIIKLLRFYEKQGKGCETFFIPGVELTHPDPGIIQEMAREALTLGAKIIVAHGETPSEPVAKGTNKACVSCKGLVDILAHPGFITEEEATLAKENGVFLELSAKPTHGETNKHVARIALLVGAKLLVNTDSHRPESYITQEKAYEIAIGCGLSEKQAVAAVRENAKELLERIKRRF